jgi:iron(III) transport system substrate-binding protein
VKNLQYRRLLILGAVSCLALPVLAQQTKANTSLHAYEGPDRMQRIIAAAKKEGSLTWYTSLAPKDSAQVIKRFEDKHGIKVTVWRSGDDNVLQRIITEAKGGANKVDVAQIQTQNMEALSREKMLMQVNSPSYKDLVPGAVPKHREWAVAQITLYAVAYNTNLIKKEDLPRSYKDLLDPKWKGKLGVESTDYDWFTIVANHYGGEAGVKMFRDIKARNGLSVRTGHSLTANMVAAGEVPMALNVYQYKAVQLKREGAPVDWFILEPNLAFSTGVGVMRNAAHPNAALLFHEFMLTEGQEVMASLDDVPSNVKVKSPLQDVKIEFVDSDAALDNRVKRETLFNDVLVK